MAKLMFNFDDEVVPVNVDDNNKNFVMKITKIEKNDDGTMSYFGKAMEGENVDYNFEYGPFADDDLILRKNIKKVGNKK